MRQLMSPVGKHPLLGFSAGLTVLLVGVLSFGVTLLRCRAENQRHHPAACSLSDQHPSAFLAATVALSLAIASLGLIRMRTTRLLLLAGLLAGAYVAYAVVVFTT
jgi:hypothetical protein